MTRGSLGDFTKLVTDRGSTRTYTQRGRERAARVLPRGVYLTPEKGWYKAVIRVGNKTKHLGVFKTVEEAQKVFLAALYERDGR